MKYYLIFIWGSTEPELRGPFDSERVRDVQAGKMCSAYGREHGYYKLSMSPNKHLVILPFGNGELEDLITAHERERGA